MALFSYGGVIQKFQKGQRPCLARRKDRLMKDLNRTQIRGNLRKLYQLSKGHRNDKVGPVCEHLSW